MLNLEKSFFQSRIVEIGLPPLLSMNIHHGLQIRLAAPAPRTTMKTIRMANIQSGISLIESLVAIVVMSLGILGILGLQLRNLADTQTSLNRAQAIRLIEDLSEKIQANPNGLGSLSAYESTWNDTPTGTCATDGCTLSEMGAYDVKQWKDAVKATLPKGDAAIFISAVDSAAENRRQLGVMVAWKANEKEHKAADGSNDEKYTEPFAPANTGSASISCPDGLICHLQYIQPNQRCTPFPMGSLNGKVPVYCPG